MKTSTTTIHPWKNDVLQIARLTKSYLRSILLVSSLAACFGCQNPISNARSMQAPSKPVYSVEKDTHGAVVSENYEDERIFTYCYLTNGSGIKVVSVYCGEPTPDALVHRRAYMDSGVIVRSEAIVSDNPMFLALEVYNKAAGKRILTDRITQGESRKYFEQYSEQEHLVDEGNKRGATQ